MTVSTNGNGHASRLRLDDVPPDLIDRAKLLLWDLAQAGQARTLRVEIDGTEAVLIVRPCLPASVLPTWKPQPAEKFVPTPFQRAILEALRDKALRTDALGDAVKDRSRVFKRNGIKELMEQGLVRNHHRLGYYRPDALPEALREAPPPAPPPPPPPAPDKFHTDTQLSILLCLQQSDKPLKFSALARRMNRKASSHLRRALYGLLEDGSVIRGVDNFYRIASPIDSRAS